MWYCYKDRPVDVWSQEFNDGKGGNATLRGSKKQEIRLNILISSFFPFFLLSFLRQVFIEFLLCAGLWDRMVDKGTLGFVSRIIVNCVKQVNLMGESNLRWCGWGKPLWGGDVWVEPGEMRMNDLRKDGKSILGGGKECTKDQRQE